jgi:hypothetical protein
VESIDAAPLHSTEFIRAEVQVPKTSPKIPRGIHGQAGEICFLDPVDTRAFAGDQGRTSQITSSDLLFPVSAKPTT